MYFNQPCPCKRSDSSSDHQNAIFHNGVLLLRKRTLKQWFQLLFKLSSCEGTQVISTLVRFHKPAQPLLFFWQRVAQNAVTRKNTIVRCVLSSAQNYLSELKSLAWDVSCQSGLSGSFEISFMWVVAKKGIGTGREGKVNSFHSLKLDSAGRQKPIGWKRTTNSASCLPV